MPVARDLGFGILLGMTQIDTIPVRNRGGRTAFLVRSVLRRGQTHVFWRVAGARPKCGFRVRRPAATVGSGWGHSTVVIPAPRSLGARGERFHGYLGTGRPFLPGARPSSRPPRAPVRHASSVW